MTPPDRASQLRHDVDDLYEIISEIRSTVDGHTVTLAEHTVKLDAILDILRAR